VATAKAQIQPLRGPSGNNPSGRAVAWRRHSLVTELADNPLTTVIDVALEPDGSTAAFFPLGGDPNRRHHWLWP